MHADDPRRAMIKSAAFLMRERGVEATSFTEVLAASGAPRGSIYHHFPGGKAQLVEEATRFAGDFIAAGMLRAFEQKDLVSALEGFTEWWRGVLRGSRFRDGCPIVAATLEGERLPAARDAAGEVFQRWQVLCAEALQRYGIPAPRARSLATTFFACIEGGIVMARAQQSLEPLDTVMDEVVAMMRDALPAGRSAPRRRGG